MANIRSTVDEDKVLSESQAGGWRKYLPRLNGEAMAALNASLYCVVLYLGLISSTRASEPSYADTYLAPNTTSRAVKKIVREIPSYLMADPRFVDVTVTRLKNGDFSAHIVADVMSNQPPLMQWTADVKMSVKSAMQPMSQTSAFDDSADRDVGNAVAAAWVYIVSREHVDPKASEFRFKLWFSRDIGDSQHKPLLLLKDPTQVRVYADFPGRYIHTGLFAQVTVSGRDGHLTYSDYHRSYGENTGQ